MQSAVIDGKVLDFHYKNSGASITAFYIGHGADEIFIGRIFKMRNGYSVISKTPHVLGQISGLRTRWQAAELLLKMEGINK